MKLKQDREGNRCLATASVFQCFFFLVHVTIPLAFFFFLDSVFFTHTRYDRHQPRRSAASDADCFVIIELRFTRRTIVARSGLARCYFDYKCR